MGINSTEVAYNFGQLGSGHVQGTSALTPPTGNYNSSQDAIENSGISDSSLSSLGESVEEEFTITATAGSATELITTATEEISDVGGTVSRDREIQSTGVTVGGGGSTRTVTTSGY